MPSRPVLIALAACLLLAGCGTTYSWGWHVVLPTTPAGRNNLQFLLSGLGYTVTLSLTALAVSIPLGLLVALPGLSGNRALRLVNQAYVETIRAVPVLVMILWVYYGLPIVVGLRLDAFPAAVLALALSDSAFEAELFRAGIQSVGRGQEEAADALGLSWADKMRFVILPQALRKILPALGNQLVYMLKMSALASVIGLTELTRRANELTVTVYRPLEIYTFLMLEYLVLVLIVSALVRTMERRLQTGSAGR